MEICKNDIAFCLREFGVSAPLREWKLLADGPDHPVPYDVIRKIVYAELADGNIYVVKFIREPVFPTSVIESQSAFSDLLREHGLDTPVRLQRDGRYCISYTKDGLTLDVTAEEWMGEKLPHLTLEIYRQTGAVLGAIHRIGRETGYRIGFSLLYDEITSRDTSYERLWQGTDHSFLSQDELDAILSVYNRRLDVIKSVWQSLPRGAVQGDIYSCNNIAWRAGRLGVYDFNLAGDEVLIGDILQCWFRTIFDEKIRDDVEKLSLPDLWSAFMQAYQRERALEEIEKRYFADVYAILGTVYYTKLMRYYVLKGDVTKAKNGCPYLMELLNTNELLL